MYLIVIIFMTAVLVHLFLRIDPVPRDSRGPRLRPGCWIRDCKFVIDAGWTHACKPFDDVIGFRIRVLEDHAVIGPEIRSFDYQRVSLPISARIAEPLTQVLSQMRPSVERDDPGGVNHFRSNDDI